MDLGLSGKVALVIGGSQGLGRAIAEQLADEGAVVTIVGRTSAKLKLAAGEIGRGCQYITADLFDRDAAQTIFKKMKANGGLPNILINNCGGPAPSSAVGVTIEDMRQQVQPMLLSIIEMSQLAIEGMQEKGWGRIITISSAGVIVPFENLVVSNTIRSALVAWNKTAASEVAAYGITMNMVVPGIISTARIERLDKDTSERLGKPIADVKAELEGVIPVGRYGTPDEFAGPTVFLASQQAAYVTGSVVRIDGGFIRAI